MIVFLLFPTLLKAEIPDSCQTNYQNFLGALENRSLSDNEAVDSCFKFINWDWKMVSDESINEISNICEDRISESSSLEDKARLHDLLRHIYQYSERIGKAVVKFEKLIAIYSVLNDTGKIIHNYHYLGMMYHEAGLYEESLITYRNIIDLGANMNPDYNLSHNMWTFGYLNSVAGWELQKPEYQDTAVKYIGQAYRYAIEHSGGANVEWTITYAMALARNGDKRKAISVATVGLQQSEKVNDLLYEARFHKQLSQYYQSLEMKDSTYYHIFKSAEYEYLMYPNGDPMEIPIGEKKSLHAFNIFFLISIYDHFGESGKSGQLLDRILEGPGQIPEYHTLMEYRGYGANSYFNNGEYKKAAYNYRLYQKYSDSIHRATLDQSKEVKTAQLESQISLEKERAAVEKKQQEELAQKEKENLRTIIYSALALAGIVIFFLVIVYRRFKVTAKQKYLIEKQKQLVESAYGELDKKNKEILDSINYATRIQNAILPPKQTIKKHLPNSFVLYLPKDIVAGDFYWLEEKNGTILFAAADCTGHGVPGAMVSVICNSGLNRSVREYNITKPSDILEKTREIIIQEFEKSEEEVNDGMDIALCAIKGNELQYAGAHNPLWIIRNGSDEIEEFKADKQPIGKFSFSKAYTNHTTTINKGDTVYVFSDGFSDQFGGERGKKYYTANLQKFLLANKDKSLEEQKQALIDEFHRWKGDWEQIDDICVIGVKF